MNAERKFRFGFVPPSADSQKVWCETARQVEMAGYDTLLVADHMGDQMMAAVPAIMSAADAAPGLRVGSVVFNNDMRNPVMLAKEAATLDVLTGGRFELGLGAGWAPDDYTMTGIPFDPPGLRVSRLEEAVSIIKDFFTGEPCSIERRYYPIQEMKGYPRSVQTPHPPLLIGGGSKRLLSFAAREADIVGLVGRRTKANTIDPATLTLEATEEKIRWIRQAAGDRFDRLEIMIYPWIIKVTNTREETEQALQFVYQYLLEQDPNTTLTLDQLRDSPYGLAGSEDYLVEKLLFLRERLGISYWVFMFGLENAVPLIKRLEGK